MDIAEESGDEAKANICSCVSHSKITVLVVS